MESGNIYHLYNHANGFENFFKDDSDYSMFLEKVIKFTSSVAKYHSYCLMPNHFHFLLETKSDEEILKTMTGKDTKKRISRAFAGAFSGFTRSINNKYSRMGSLFKPNMGSRQILDENDFCSTVHYIHANPVHHGFVNSLHEWKHSSFNSILEGNSSWLNTKIVLDYFGNLHEFIKYHNQPITLKIKEKVYF